MGRWQIGVSPPLSQGLASSNFSPRTIFAHGAAEPAREVGLADELPGWQRCRDDRRQRAFLRRPPALPCPRLRSPGPGSRPHFFALSPPGVSGSLSGASPMSAARLVGRRDSLSVQFAM